MEVTLYPHQQKFIEKNPAKYFLAWEMRLGKTLAALLWTKKIPEVSITIICPKFLTAQWREECEKAGVIADIYGKERFRIDHKNIARCDTIIIDEAHTVSQPKSGIAKALSWYIFHHNPQRVLLLTGTPFTSTPFSVWQYGVFLGRWKKDTWAKFREKYFYQQYFGARLIYLPKTDQKTKDSLTALLRSFGETLSVKEVFALPQNIITPVYFEESRAQKRLKDKNEDVHHLAMITAFHQIEAGEGQKDEWLKDMATKHEKLVVVCRYNEQIERLEKILQNTLVLNGATKDKKAVIDEAERLEKCILLVNVSIGAGYGLPSFPIMIFASCDWSYVNYSQMLMRNQGPKQLQKTATYILITKGGVDEKVWRCLQDKKDFTVALFLKV